MLASRLRQTAVFCLLLAACGGDDDDDDVETRSPTQRCEDLAADLCARYTECAEGIDEAVCVEQIEDVLRCPDTVYIGDRYDSCVDSVNSLSCSELFPIDPDTNQPTLAELSECRSVILYEE